MSMAKIVVLDAGHGGSDPGAVLGSRKESNDVLKVVNEVKKHLERCGVTVRMTRTSDTTVSLTQRSDYEKKQNADLFVSVHRNAFNKSAKGVETYAYAKTGTSWTLANNIQNEIVKVGVSANRGCKVDNFHVLRETKSPAVLIELLFIDNTEDNKMFDNKFNGYCEAIAKGIVSTLGIKYVAPSSSSDIWYRVIIDGKQIEALRTLEDAKSSVKRRIDAKEGKVGKVQRNTDGAWLWEYPVAPTTPKTPIMGKAQAKAGQMKQFLLDNNKSPKLNCTVDELVTYFIQEGDIEGVRGDIAFCQAIKETGYFKYGGQVLPEQNNYCGLGAVNNSPTGKGAWFGTPQIGVRAQVQHLQAYASKDSLKQACVDPRYSLVSRGVAPNWEDLNGKWAVPGNNYGEEILEIYKRLIKSAEAPIETHKCVDRDEVIKEVLNAVDEVAKETKEQAKQSLLDKLKRK